MTYKEAAGGKQVIVFPSENVSATHTSMPAQAKVPAPEAPAITPQKPKTETAPEPTRDDIKTAVADELARRKPTAPVPEPTPPPPKVGLKGSTKKAEVTTPKPAKKPIRKPTTDTSTLVSDLFTNKKPITEVTHSDIEAAVDALDMSPTDMRTFAIGLGISTAKGKSRPWIKNEIKSQLKNKRTDASRPAVGGGGELVACREVTQPANPANWLESLPTRNPYLRQ